MQADSRILAALTGLLLAVISSGCSGDSSPIAQVSAGEYLARLPAPGDVPGFDAEMAVEEAYRAIPHRRTAFDFDATEVPEDVEAYLSLVFHTVDQAIVLRVTSYQDYRDGSPNGASRELEKVIGFLEELPPPSSLKAYHEELLLAVKDQRAFFVEWEAQGNGFAYNLGKHPKVRSASRHLHAAYNVLMRTYPGESRRNKDAFFDYHCALDFL